MVMTKVGIAEETLNNKSQINDRPSVNFSINKTRIVTLNANEVAWLFGVDNTIVEAWVNAGTLPSCSSTTDGLKRFWRKDVADLLAAFGA